MSLTHFITWTPSKDGYSHNNRRRAARFLVLCLTSFHVLSRLNGKSLFTPKCYNHRKKKTQFIALILKTGYRFVFIEIFDIVLKKYIKTRLTIFCLDMFWQRNASRVIVGRCHWVKYNNNVFWTLTSDRNYIVHICSTYLN